MKRIIFVISLFILCMGCSKQQPGDLPIHIKNLKNLTIYPIGTEPAGQINFNKENVYDNPKEVLIGEIGDIAVDDSGRVYIPDQQQNIIDVFKPDGQFIMHLGRKGRGPGEFTGIWDLQIRDHKLFVEDLTTNRFNIFTLCPLRFDCTVNLARNRQKFNKLRNADPNLTHLYVRNNDTYLVEFTKSTISKSRKVGDKSEVTGLYYLLDKDGNISSQELFEVKSSTIVYIPWPPPHPTTSVGVNVGFYGKSMTVLSGDNHIFWAGPDDFLIKVYSPNGAYQRAFYYPHKRVPLTRESASKAGIPDFLIKNMQSLKLPKTWPALFDMKIDSKNRLWVATIIKNMKVYQWWVLSQNGKLLARFTWPRDKPIEVIKKGSIYTRETNKKTGLGQIVRYRIEMQ